MLGDDVTYSDAFVEAKFLFVVLVGIKWIQDNVVVHEFSPNLLKKPLVSNRLRLTRFVLTLCLKSSRSSNVKLSALAMTGTTFTTSLSFFMTMISIGRRE